MLRDVVSTLSFSSSSSSFPICAIIIRNRFDSASTVACIRSDRILDFENGCTSRRESVGEFQN